MASSDSAPATSPAAKTFSPSNRPRSASEVDTWVPFNSARPSLGPRTIGSRPTRASPSRAGCNSPLIRTSPSPSSIRERCARGARSPDAPTEPFSGIHGITPALNRLISASTSSIRIPEWPRARLIILVAITRRTTSSGNNSPKPTLCDSTRLRCSSASLAAGMDVCASLPNPVLIPYVTLPSLTI